MPFQIITIPFDPALEVFSEEQVNRFLINKKLLSWQAEFFKQANKAYWSVFLEYEFLIEKKASPKTKLTEEQQVLYQKLKEWRKEQAEKQGVPVYVIANNQHLEELTVKQPKTLEAFKEIKGLGDKKLKEYGQELISLMVAFNTGDSK
jgi:superfamily II DNA helicase RecQ